MIAQVIPLRRMPPHLAWLDYVVPEELKDKITPGQLIKIPFRSSLEFGIVWSLLDQPEVDTSKLKPISEVALERPLLNLAQLRFLQEMAELYATPLGFLVKGNLLPLKKRKIEALKEQKTKNKEQREIKQSKPQLTIYKNLDEKKECLQSSIPDEGQSLILVPELHNINEVINLLTSEQQNRIIVISSETSEKELFDTWLEIWENQDVIIVGTRRALFLPFHNLQTIIVDDESNSAHKSWDMAPRFHTRDAVLLLSHHHGAALHLLTHTPSIETYYFASKDVYVADNHLLNLSFVRRGQENPPSQGGRGVLEIESTFQIINMRDERRGGNYAILADEVTDAMNKNTNGITFLYLNRKGNLHYIACRDCGNVTKCAKCNSSLTYYENKGQLLCHHCGHTETLHMTCKKCGGTSSVTAGAGTQQLYKEVKKLLGNKRNIVRIDTDDGNEDVVLHTPGTIIIGTQYAWGRIPWSRINLMAFVDADTPLFVPEYKTTEELWHQLRDASFRLEPVPPLLGKGEDRRRGLENANETPPPTPPFAKEGERRLFIQTSHQEHLIFQALFRPEQFYESELKSRKLFGYPPFNFLVKFFAGFPNENIAKIETDRFSRTLAQLTKGSGEVTISLPVPSFPPYAKGKFWYIILAKVSYSKYKKWTKLLVSRMPPGWKVDPNPNSILGI